MYCPKCGKENPDNAQSCSSCGCALMQTPDVKTSKLAVTSCVFGVLSLPAILMLVVPPNPSMAGLMVGIASFISAILAVLLGIISLVLIAASYGRLTGRGFAAIGISIPIVLLFLAVFFVVFRRPVKTAYPLYCGTNLSGIGKAMLIYSNDYDNELPRAGGPTTKWGRTPNWQAGGKNSTRGPTQRDWRASTRRDAFGLNTDGTGGQATISASLYLLIKYAEVTPKSFVCKGDSGVKEFKPSDYGVGSMDLIDFWDFGPNPAKHCSYSYHIPYSPYALTSSSDPGLAVAADRNPWMPPNNRPDKDWNKFDPVGDWKAVKYGNAITHQFNGQNVLFMDAHVRFEKNSACGINDDNIYTYWNDKDISRGTRPVLGSQPADANDSLLVHDPPAVDRK